MALFVLGDPHLSLGASKPMDIFPGWNDYVERLEKNWRKLIQPGKISIGLEAPSERWGSPSTKSAMLLLLF